MSSSLSAALIIAAVMAALFAVALFLISRAGTRAERRAEDLRAEVEQRGEAWEIPFAGATYQGGGSAAAHSRGRGVLGMTDRRVLFLPIAGELVVIPRARVSAVRVEDRRREAASAHRHHLVLTLDDGAEAAFLVDDPAPWQQALAPPGDDV
ncbi:MAG TPA: hypothetical protein VMH50_18605 [Thermoleophilia bacterium]|nr:hypothetical protein [Thermoleophilia bacterium]